ncbi:MAG: GNAT family N-acetyltransferase [Phycisphaerales bacterium]|nr:GNAT family N-acetyltransferase [Phycisphaerales bacterium]
MLVLIDPTGASDVRYRALDLTQWLGQIGKAVCLDLRTMDLRVPDERTPRAKVEAFLRETWMLVEKRRGDATRLVVVVPEIASGHLDEIAFWFTALEDEAVFVLRANEPEGSQYWAEPNAGLVLSNAAEARIEAWRPDALRLESERLVLTDPTAAQSAAYHDLIRGTDVFDTLLWEGPKDVDDLRRGAHFAHRARLAGTRYGFAVIEPGEGIQIGGVSYRPCEADPKSGDLGYMIASSHQGKGYGREAVARILRFAFEEADAERVWADIFVGNRASAALVEGLGLVLEGTLIQGIEKRGVRMDEWRYAITREAWTSRHGH